jgi:mono/diheme cytochrome c family protein
MQPLVPRILTVTTLLLMVASVPGKVMAASDAGSMFKEKCTLCHGPDGSGKTPTGTALKAKDLRSDEVQKQTDAELTEFIRKGRNKMPAFGQKFKPEQIQQLIEYVRQLKK